MKKQILIGLIGVSLLASGSAVHAQSVVGTTTAVTATSTATTSKPLSATAMKKLMLQTAVTKMENSLQVRIDNLDDFAQRIQERIRKSQLEGKDMTLASAKLVVAQKAITAVKAEMAILKKADTAMVASAKPLTGFTNIKNKLVKNVATKIKTAHTALVDTIVAMKGQGMPASATSTIMTGTSTIQ